MKSDKRFYKDGIRFACKGDGRCCVSRGKYSYVYLSFGDRKRLAARLNLSVAEFTRKYAKKEDGLYTLMCPGKGCPFFKNNACEVYDSRPWQCRTWPFWPENMDPVVWERDVAGFCPGVGSGRLYAAEEIEAILRKKMDVTGKAG